MQRVEFKGRLGKDCELKYTQSNKKICDNSVAVNEKNGDKEFTTWFNIRAWEYNAEKLKDMKKGESVFIIGRFRSEKYTSKDGSEKQYYYFLVDNIMKIDEQKKEKKEENKTNNWSLDTRKGFDDEDMKSLDWY